LLFRILSAIIVSPEFLIKSFKPDNHEKQSLHFEDQKVKIIFYHGKKNYPGNYLLIHWNFCAQHSHAQCQLPDSTITGDQSTTFCDWSYIHLSAATGSGFSYQWKESGNDIAGATSAVYTAAVSGSYSCQITNSCGSVLSNTIVITVIPTPAPVITADGPTNYCIGGSVTLSTNPEPPGAGFSYQWYVNGGSLIDGATSSSYTATGTGGTYTCVVSNVCGTVSSNGILVWVSQIPGQTPSMITGNAKPCPFIPEVYSVDPSPYVDVTFNWSVPAGGTITSGQGTNAITVDFNSSMTSGKVQVVASTPCGSSNPKSKHISKNNNCGARLSASFDEEQMDVMVYPNPSNDYFNLTVMNEASCTCKLLVYDLAGRIVEQMDINSGVPVEFGKRLAAGMYQVEIVSSEERKVFRVAKSN
jgi:PKD-like domain/Secretion system C-terminal sorting domain